MSQLGHPASIPTRPVEGPVSHVIADVTLAVLTLPGCATSRHMQCGKTALFDHLVGTSKKRCRNVQTERLCGLEVDDKLELGRLLDRKLASALACKDSGDISRGGAIKLEVVGRVAH